MVETRAGRRRWGRGSAPALLLALALAAPVPAEPAPEAPRHLVYLHGRIVQEEQSARPRHPRYGVYELEAIREAFRRRGFVVHGEIRPRGATVEEAADRVVAEVRGLLSGGVPADRILVAGASMGGAIALLAAARLGLPELRVATLGTCLASTLEYLEGDGVGAPVGPLLSIREASDELTEPCPPWRAPGPGGSPVVRELLLDTGLAHGFLYRPLPEWVEPVAAWAEGDGATPAP